jgi:hypothetical protein
MKKILILAQLLTCMCAPLAAITYPGCDELIYAEESEGFCPTADGYYIKVGGNRWIQSQEVHRNAKGLFTYLSKVRKIEGPGGATLIMWQCPYCDEWWPENISCQNSRCPSTYKVMFRGEFEF